MAVPFWHVCIKSLFDCKTCITNNSWTSWLFILNVYMKFCSPRWGLLICQDRFSKFCHILIPHRLCLIFRLIHTKELISHDKLVLELSFIHILYSTNTLNNSIKKKWYAMQVIVISEVDFIVPLCLINRACSCLLAASTPQLSHTLSSCTLAWTLQTLPPPFPMGTSACIQEERHQQGLGRQEDQAFSNDIQKCKGGLYRSSQAET